MRLITMSAVGGLVLGCIACAAADGRSSPDSTTGGPPAASSAPPPASSSDSIVALADRSRILGDSAAPLWVVIVSDFQCPYCKVWHDATFPAVKSEFVDRGRIRLAYLNLPLGQHQHAQTTAELALCAGAQGRFWEFHDALFDSQTRWSAMPTGTPFFLDSVAPIAGVDRGRLNACLAERTMMPLVQGDYQRAVAAKVRSTPTFFIGDQIRIVGAEPIGTFRDSIAKALGRPATSPRP